MNAGWQRRPSLLAKALLKQMIILTCLCHLANHLEKTRILMIRLEYQLTPETCILGSGKTAASQMHAWSCGFLHAAVRLFKG